MKSKLKLLPLLVLISLVFTACDANDDTQNDPQNPTDGFSINGNFYETPNAYIAIDQADRDQSGHPDYYTFFFANGRITDTFGDQGVGYAYAYSTNTTQLVKLQVLESDNPTLGSGTITTGHTYTASSILTSDINGFGVPNTGFSKDSFISNNLQAGTSLGSENGLNFSQIPEAIGLWHYPGTVGPSLVINAVHIDMATPANSTIDVDYTFMDIQGNQATGHYEGTLGIILD